MVDRVRCRCWQAKIEPPPLPPLPRLHDYYTRRHTQHTRPHTTKRAGANHKSNAQTPHNAARRQAPGEHAPPRPRIRPRPLDTGCATLCSHCVPEAEAQEQERKPPNLESASPRRPTKPTSREPSPQPRGLSAWSAPQPKEGPEPEARASRPSAEAQAMQASRRRLVNASSRR
jgi:hypothetical protein